MKKLWDLKKVLSNLEAEGEGRDIILLLSYKAIHKARILMKKPLEKTFLDFKKWVKSIETAGYNGKPTVYSIIVVKP